VEDHEETMVVSTELRGHQAVIVLEGELDLHTGLLLTDAVERAITEGATSLDIDAARLTFADSSGLCALVACRRTARGAGADIRVTHASAPLDRVLEMTGLRRVFVPLDA
jgi:anti-anti-sigma factor